jgi:hypothetical protein
MMAQYAPKEKLDPNCTFEKFETAGKASFKHHWNNHQYCGDWCKPKNWTKETKEKNKHKYWDKVTNKQEYEQQFEIWERFYIGNLEKVCRRPSARAFACLYINIHHLYV